MTTAPSTLPGTLTVALAGNPNSGKTTLFNALTGLRQKVANYPGVTVEKKTGRCALPGGRDALIIDLPGTYSLVSRSPDEHVAMEVLRGQRPDTPAPDVVVAVVDASNLQRNLYLVSQLIELQRPLVIALNMTDLARQRGLDVCAEKLAAQLGVPVVPLVGHRRQGIEALKQAILQAKIAPEPHWPLPDAMRREMNAVGTQLGEHEPAARARLAERLLIGDHAADVLALRRNQAIYLTLESALRRLNDLGIDPMQADVEAHYQWIESVARSALSATSPAPAAADPAHVPDYKSVEALTPTERVDRVLLHRFWGLTAFVLIMAGLFVSIFWIADPLMGQVEGAVAWMGEQVSAPLPDGPVKALLTDGIFAGVGAVIVFVPQIAILFALLAVLEDSGYLARAAFLLDRVLHRVGLHGKSFIPMLSSFACAIPGIMAARTIESPRDRLATIFVAPFMSCSARLPVYALLIGAFFAGYGALVQGGVLLACYLLGIVAAAATAWAFNRPGKGGGTSAFILEMPAYKVPQLSQVLRHAYAGTREFVLKAGTIIFCLSVILWALMYYPRLPDERVAQLSADVAAGEQLRHSFAGRFGRAIEPAIAPLGYDWKIGVGLVGAFAAREVFVSTMGIVYSVGDAADDTTSLESAMRDDRYPDGRPVWTLPVAISLLVWFVLAMQCMSTLAVVRRETGGWKWPILMLLYMNAVAYVAAMAAYQASVRWVGG